jgi:hypothetical protein
MSNIELIQSGIKISNQLKSVTFPELVKATSDYEVIRFDLNSVDDTQLFNQLTKSAKNLVQYMGRNQLGFKAIRPNEVGKRIEEVFVEELKKTDLKPIQLKSSGYPDIKIIDSNGNVTFLESKATSTKKNTSLRSFYYSNGKKINATGKHLPDIRH